MDENAQTDDALKRHKLTAAACVVFLSAMIGMSYAAVPLYELFCKVTGYGGTTQVAEAEADQILDREITIRFDANVAGGLPWKFKPIERQVTLKVGETGEATYGFTNVADVANVGTSTFNVTPLSAGVYFNKLECFCFTEQQLASGETVEMPVVFFIDPAIAEDPELDLVNTITLSYTFFPVANPTKPLANLDAAEQKKTAEKL
ncbi:MAG: cytochrome c oxidase assembly protein [Hyphomicrobiales bacterium]